MCSILWCGDSVPCLTPHSHNLKPPYRKPTLKQDLKQDLTPPAPACQGQQGCGFRIPLAFQELSIMLPAISHLLAVYRLQNLVICPRHPPRSRSVAQLHNKNSIIFQVCFRGNKNQKITEKTKRKITTSKIQPESIKNDFYAKLISAVRYMRKHGVLSPKSPNFDSEID